MPNGYSLNNSAGKYSISNSSYSDYQKQHGNLPIVVSDDRKGTENSMYNLTDPVVHVQFKDQNTGNVVGMQNIDLSKMGSRYYGNKYNVPAGYIDDSGEDWQFNKDQDINYKGTISARANDGTNETYTTSLSASNRAIKSLLDRLGVDLAPGQSVSLPFVAITDGSFWIYQPDFGGNYVTATGSFDSDIRSLYSASSGGSIDITASPSGPVKYSFFPHNHVVENDAVIVPVHKTNIVIFNDDSGNAISSSGNTVNVALTKPQSVDPATNSQLHSSAMRTIKIDFPNNVIPPSYKNIVDSNGVLTQTVKFTRTGQMDMLTDDIINSSLGPWKSDNSDPNFLGFPERTLPRIPGYTLSIKSA